MPCTALFGGNIDALHFIIWRKFLCLALHCLKDILMSCIALFGWNFDGLHCIIWMKF